MKNTARNKGNTYEDMEYLRKLAERKEKELENIIGAAADGVGKFACNPQFTILYYTDKLAQLAGTASGVLEQDGFISSRYIHPDDLLYVKENIEDAARKLEPFSICFRLKHQNGGDIWIKAGGTFLDEMYEETYPVFYLFCTDITEQKQREQELLLEKRKTETALEGADLLFWEYDIRNKISYHKGGKEDRLGFSKVIENVPEVMIERGFIHKESIEDYRNLYRRISAGEEKAETVIRVHGGEKGSMWLRIWFTTIFDEQQEPVRAIGFGIDITEYKEQEQRYQEEMQYMDAVTSTDLLAKYRANITKNIAYQYDGAREDLLFMYSSIYTQTVLNVASLCATKEMQRKFIREMMPEPLMELYKSGRTEHAVEYRRKMKDGSLCWVKTYVKIFRDPESSDIMCFMYTYDINAVKMNRMALNTVVKSNYDFVGILNIRTGFLTGIHGSQNPIQPGEVYKDYEDGIKKIVNALKDYYDDEEDYLLMTEQTSMEALVQKLEEEEIYEFHVKIWNLEHTVLHTYLKSYRYMDAEKTQILICRTDITRSVQEEVQQQALLRSALEQAEAASHTKSDFLSRMSHEIRTPMNAIIGMSALAAQCVSDPKQVSACISKIGISARFLLSLINDILDMSRIESGRMILKDEKIPFEEFIGGINAICYEQAAEKGVDYEAVVTNFIEDYYMGDAMKLQQVLINLISNAVKFTPQGGKVQFLTSQEKVQNGKAYMKFSIIDTGIGISEAFLPRLYEPFEQECSGVTSCYGGTGLGLAIVKNLVTMMGGTIQVNSIVGVGTEFSVNIVLKLCEERLRDVKFRHDMNWSKLEALIVDDDVIVCKNTQDILTDIGMKAEWVDSGCKAIENVQKKWESGRYYDIILVDWKMSEMDGIETARRIRSIVGQEVTIIIMTAYDWASIEQEAKMAGVNLMISKPLFKTSLVSTFQRIYNEKEYSRQENTVQVYDFSGKRALLVEDHVLNIEVAKRLLESKGMAVEVAENGLSAIEIFTLAPLGHFDVILMDIRMPVMDGLTAARSIRQLKKKSAKRIPIIAMSANAFDEDVEKSKAAGMNAHIAKPIEPQTLYCTLQEFMSDSWKEE